MPRSKYEGIVLTPLLDQKINAPGTANTHGDYRQNYKKVQQFDMPSKQCQSELYHLNYNTRKNTEDGQIIYNLSNNNGLDPNEDDDHIPSIQNITAIRNQRS